MTPDRSHLPYRRNVGIMVLNHDGDVWVGSRANTKGTEYERADTFWQMPQGGIDDGEDAQAAGLRELYEETGMASVTLLATLPDWVYYDFPANVTRKIAEKYRGQEQMWYAYRFEGEIEEIRINPPPDGHKAEFDQWKWVPMNTLPRLVVEFKREVYEQVVAGFSELVS